MVSGRMTDFSQNRLWNVKSPKAQTRDRSQALAFPGIAGPVAASAFRTLLVNLDLLRMLCLVLPTCLSRISSTEVWK